jgi:hypothetical protein
MTPYLQTTLEDGEVEQSTRMRLVFRTRGTIYNFELGATHREKPIFTWSRQVNRYFDITARLRQTQIFTTLFRIPIEQIPRLIGMELTDKTVSISGSKKTAGTRGTIEKVQEVRKKENDRQGIQRLT